MRRITHWGRIIFASLLLLTMVVAVTPAKQAEASHARWCPQQTGFCSENAFLDFWRAVDEATGGYALDIIGFPITPALRAPNGLIVQFYERAIFEWHPQNRLEYQVLLTRLGAFAIENDTRLGLKQEAAAGPKPCENANTCYIFNATNHTLRGTFLQYWTENGGLPVFGMAMTEQFQLRYTDGNVYTVQYFERNRFEAHPENSNRRYQVLLGRLGFEELQRNYNVVKDWQVVTTPHYGSGVQ